MAEFEIGDLGWAKMKGFSPWPAQITEPPKDVKPPKSKEIMHYVCFFGTKDYSWIPASNILTFEDGKVKFGQKNGTASFKKAVQEMLSYAEKHPEKIKSEKESKSNGVTPKPVKSVPVKISSPKKKSPKERPAKREAKTPTGSIRKKKRLSSDSNKLLLSDTEEKEGHPEREFRLAIEEKERSPSPYISRPKKSFKTSFNWNMSGPPISATSGLINRPMLENPVAPSINLEKKSEKLVKSNIVPTSLKIGFLGLGIMGGSMVKNLLHTGHKVTVWNRTPDKCVEFVEAGASQGQTPGDVVAASDIIFSCLSEPQAAKDLIFCNCGVLQMCTQGKGYIEMTSIDPETSLVISEALTLRGGKYLEVPVLGTRKRAEEGTLTLLAAGDQELFSAADSCFKAIGQKMFFLGDVGKASKMNLVVNAVMGSCFSAVAEAMALAERCGIPRKKVLEIFQTRDLDCPAIIQQAQSIVEERFIYTNMPLQHMQRNLHLALEIGDQFSQPLPTIAAANEVFKHAKRLGFALHDVSAVFLRSHS